MSVDIRAATLADLPAMVEVYNHYVLHTPITFDLEPFDAGSRRPWFDQFSSSGPHRLLVAADAGEACAYACTHRFHPRAAYDTTVETTIYCAPGRIRQGIGSALYGALFDAVRDEDIRMMVAGITLPNDASEALHQRFGFVTAGVTHAVGRKFGRYWDVVFMERRMGRGGR